VSILHLSDRQKDRAAFADALRSAFGKIYCINLDSRPDRWARASKHFEELRIATLVERHPAKDFRSDPSYAHLERLQNGKYSLLGNTGCAYSHREITKNAKALGLDSVLVFEDDVKILAPEFCQANEALRDLKKQSWNLFYLGATYHKPL